MLLAAALLASSFLYYLSLGAGTFALGAWLAPVPILYLALRGRTGRAAWRASALAGLAFAAGSLSLVPLYREVVLVPVLVAATLLPALAFAGLVRLWLARAERGPARAALGFACAWTALEWLLSRVSPHGTAGALGYSQGRHPLVIQVASLCGVHAVTFVLIVVPVGAATALGLGRRGARALVLAAAVLGLVLGFGAVRLRGHGSETVRVALLASDAFPEAFEADAPEVAEAVVAAYAAAVEALPPPRPACVVLPEAIVAERAGSADRLHGALAALARTTGATLVAGVRGDDRAPPGNLALVYAADGRSLGEYRKRHLVPGLERAYAPGDATLLVGDGVGVALCKDLDFQDAAVDYGRAGARLVLAPAWDFGADGELHARLAVLRAVEGGFALARSARSGLLSVHDAWGRELARAPSAVPMASLVVDVPLGSPAAPFPWLGAWFGGALVLGALLLFAGPSAGMLGRRSAH